MTRTVNQNIPHRKNAAEWMMWLCLQPVAWLVRAVAGAKMTNKGQ